MKITLIAVLAALPAVSYAAVSETLSAGAVRSFSLALPEARLVLASEGDAALRGALYGLAAAGIELEKGWKQAVTGTHNIGRLIEYLSSTEDGPKQIAEHLDNFSHDTAALAEAVSAMNKDAQDAAAKANANAKAGSAAQAFKNEALRLRAFAAGLADKTATLAENVKIYQIKLGSETVKTAQKLLAQVKALELGVDALVDTADEIAKKS